MQARVVLIGDSEESLVGLIKELVEDALGDQYHLGFLEASTGEALSRLASDNVVDIFVLTLNNLVFGPQNMPAEKRLGHALDLVRAFKLQYQKPVIVFSAAADSREAALRAGADLFMALPFEHAVLQHHIRSLLAAGDC